MQMCELRAQLHSQQHQRDDQLEVQQRQRDDQIEVLQHQGDYQHEVHQHQPDEHLEVQQHQQDEQLEGWQDEFQRNDPLDCQDEQEEQVDCQLSKASSSSYSGQSESQRDEHPPSEQAVGQQQQQDDEQFLRDLVRRLFRLVRMLLEQKEAENGSLRPLDKAQLTRNALYFNETVDAI